ncbi:MAG TPA: HIT domain-containing protein [Candidatus Binataceae bacterium]|jgi:ATP adenylyltransferase|nr:HIT domain-containing protein [Candidatus Binataceae bacterium]
MAPKRTPRRAQPEAASGPARLWAPWRAAYLRAVAGRAPRGCIFCFGKLGVRERRRRLVLWAGPLAVVMLNRYPYNNGHLMIAPRRHLASPELLDRAERATLAELQAAAVERLRRALKCDGLNLGVNLGRSAGAGFADHMHWHVVPRWEGDVNFMPVIAGTRVLSQHLEETFDLLSPLFKTVGAAIS